MGFNVSSICSNEIDKFKDKFKIKGRRGLFLKNFRKKFRVIIQLST